MTFGFEVGLSVELGLVVGRDLLGVLDRVDQCVDALLVGVEHDELAVLVPCVFDGRAFERLRELTSPLIVPVGQVVRDLFGLAVEEGVAIGFVDQTIRLLLVLFANDERRPVPRVCDAVVAEQRVDREPLHRFELVELVRDLLFVLVAQLFERDRPTVGQGHQTVSALEHALDILRPAQCTPTSHGRKPLHVTAPAAARGGGGTTRCARARRHIVSGRSQPWPSPS